MISIKDLFIKSNEKEILKGLNLQIKSGQIHIVMGPNGSGKSSLLNFLAGSSNFQLVSGEVVVDSASFYKANQTTNFLELEPDIRSKMGIFLAFQNPVDLPGISPISFLKTIYNLHRSATSKQELDSSEFLKLLESKMQEFGFSRGFMEKRVLEGMSGGEKKNFELLQIVLLEPKLILLDEIDSGLDLDGIKKLVQIIHKLKSSDRSWLIVTHNPKILEYFEYDFVHLLKNGIINQSGGSELVDEIVKKGFDEY